MPDQGCVRVTIEQKDTDLTHEQLGLHVNEDGQVVENDGQILDAVRNAVGEQIRDQNGQYTFAVRRAKNVETGVWMTYVYPKPGYGM